MKKLLNFFGFILIMNVVLSSCEFEATTAHLTDIKTCVMLSGDLCDQENPVFNTTDPQIYVSCKLKNAPENTLITFVWKYMEGEPIIIDEVTLNSSAHGINLDLNSSLSRPNNGWPIGKYTVEITIGDGGSTEVKTFQVR